MGSEASDETNMNPAVSAIGGLRFLMHRQVVLEERCRLVSEARDETVRALSEILLSANHRCGRRGLESRMLFLYLRWEGKRIQ